MKKLGLILITTFITLKLFAGIDDNIRAVVHKWNEIHNTHNSIEFLDIYAPEVLFYGKVNDRDYCFKLKTKFLNSDFKQEIITPIDLTYYSTGTIKCDFTKRTSFSGKPREHLCYLLIKKINNKYLITGESDVLTDEKKNIQLQLGSAKLKPALRNAIYILIVLLLIIGSAIWFQLKRKRERVMLQPHDFSTIPPAINLSQPVKEEKTGINIKNDLREVLREELGNLNPIEAIEKQKGNEFEKFIIERFDNTYFNLKEWRSDKIHKGIYPESNMNPDLVYHFSSNSADLKFAIECKWRAGFNSGSIEWAKTYQLNNYRKFERENGTPVFVIIGIGGTPGNPDSLYVIPLKQINTTVLSEYQLKKYYRYGKGNFFLDTYSITLK